MADLFPERIQIGIWDNGGGFAGPFDANMKNGRPDLEVAQYIRASDAEAEAGRLRRVMAAALERTQVDDCGEATAILEAEVNLDGSSARP
jgi:hypothetical protein